MGAYWGMGTCWNKYGTIFVKCGEIFFSTVHGEVYCCRFTVLSLICFLFCSMAELAHSVFTSFHCTDSINNQVALYMCSTSQGMTSICRACAKDFYLCSNFCNSSCFDHVDRANVWGKLLHNLKVIA